MFPILIQFTLNLFYETIACSKEHYLLETEIFCNITHDFSFFLQKKQNLTDPQTSLHKWNHVTSCLKFVDLDLVL